MKSNLYLLCGLLFLMACKHTKMLNNKNYNNLVTKVIAHRGAWKKSNLPENSIASLKQAIKLGCYGSEFDVRMTLDDSLIINHDAKYHNLEIEQSKYSDLIKYTLSNSEKLPTLQDYIIAGMQNNYTTKLICEIKPSEVNAQRAEYIATKTVELFDKLNANKKVVFISFDFDILQKIKRISPNASVQYLEANKTPKELKQSKISGVNYNYTSFQNHSEWINEAKQNKITLNAWTVNDTSDMDWLIANKFDFITTNEPELLIRKIQQSPINNGWNLWWYDEFNYNGLPDTTKWNAETGGHGWGNNEKQYYVDNSIENSFVKDGKLHIVALQKNYEHLQYTSAKLTTYQKLNLQYGKIEVSAKLPKGKGSWPAIWMLPITIKNNKEPWPLCGEIDIMEHVGKDQNVVHTSLHSALYNHIKQTQITHFDTINNVSDVFHKYGIEWTTSEIKFFIDDNLFYTSTKGENNRVATNEGWPFDKPYFLILNYAVGGNWGGEIDNSIFPSDFQIDYVRIYKHK